MILTLFICLGNICRSPMAEAIFNHKIAHLGLGHLLKSDSVGTAGYHVGEPPDIRTIRVVEQQGIAIRHIGKQLQSTHKKQFTYFMAMDQANFRDVISLFGSKPTHLHLLRDFDSLGKGLDVPDPFYGADNDFEQVFQILDRSIDSLITYIQKKEGV